MAGAWEPSATRLLHGPRASHPKSRTAQSKRQWRVGEEVQAEAAVGAVAEAQEEEVEVAAVEVARAAQIMPNLN